MELEENDILVREINVMKEFDRLQEIKKIEL